MIDAKEIEKRFTHHAPDLERALTHGDIRQMYRDFANEIVAMMPDGREKSLAFTALEESSFWAHAAVAREGK